ncbi:hypothetical protein P43SY_007641 [Pythium insidiosum]|uniref:PH domain-containing protein n=1 Tax=Pythium insidiosum TaxID=114742 RepID=A0AAD5Q6W3_PYTIN|nr:hypothetical protein P43SY_007641 [Pythium insidiosum]
MHGDHHEERRPLEAHPQFDASVMKEGYLQKKGQMLKGWKQRWFVCDGRTLCYYSSRRDAKPSVVMELRYCSVEDGGRSETWNSTRIHVTDSLTGTMYCLSSEEGAVATEWLHVLRNAIARVANERQRHRMASQPATTLRSAAAAATSSTASAAAESQPRTTRMTSAPSGASTTTSANSSSASSNNSSSSRPPIAPSASLPLPAATTAPSVVVPPRSPPVATNVTMENELARDMEALRALLARHARVTSLSSPVVFTPLRSPRDGLLCAIGRDKTRQQWVVRGSVMLSVPPEIAVHYISDHARRGEWDVHFPRAQHVASLDDTTEIVHLSGAEEGDAPTITVTKPLVTPQRAALLGALAAAGLMLVLTSPSDQPVVAVSGVALAALIAVVVNSVDYSALCAPRDLLVLRQIRRNRRKAKAAVSGVSDDEDDDDHFGRNAVITILEKSVANERRPERSGVVRATQTRSGWLLEPTDGGRGTVVTHVSDIDVGGSVSDGTRRAFLVERLECLAVLRDVVALSKGSVDSDSEDDEDGDGEEIVASSAVAPSSSRKKRTSFASSAAGSTALTRDGNSFHPADYMHGMVRLPTGGLKLTDKEVAKKQAGVLKDVLKSASSSLLEGKGVVGLSLPVRIFEPRTNLERLVDLFLYGPTFLSVAASQRDPVERFKYVMAYAVAGLHHGVGQLKPFNPILGETYQAELNDGTLAYCEHTSHHPPISNFEVLNDRYSICGHILWNSPKFSMKSSSFTQNNAGPIRVTLRTAREDGQGDEETVVTYQLPQMQSGGFLWGDRTVELLGVMHFEDPKHGLVCELKFHPDEKKGMGGMFSSSATPSDCMRGVVLQNNREVSHVSGSWLDGLEFDGKAYWTRGREASGFVVGPIKGEPLLESDSRCREDLKFLAAWDLDQAQEWKVKLEVLQRADRKIRNDGRRPNHWALKKDGGH